MTVVKPTVLKQALWIALLLIPLVGSHARASTTTWLRCTFRGGVTSPANGPAQAIAPSQAVYVWNEDKKSLFDYVETRTNRALIDEAMKPIVDDDGSRSSTVSTEGGMIKSTWINKTRTKTIERTTTIDRVDLTILIVGTDSDARGLGDYYYDRGHCDVVPPQPLGLIGDPKF